MNDLRWALAGIELVANGLRNRRNLTPDDVEMQNLAAVKASIKAALVLQEQQQRKGMVLVPREPTGKMIYMAMHCLDGVDLRTKGKIPRERKYYKYVARYKAMIGVAHETDKGK